MPHEARTRATELVVALIACCWLSAGVAAQESVADLLPLGGEFEALLMQPGFSPECEVLLARMQAAVASEPEWWLDAIKQVPPGEPVAYDPRLGLTEDEYEAVLGCQDSIRMTPVGSGKLTVMSRGDGVFEITADGILANLSGIQIDTQEDEVRTPLGTAHDRSPIDAPAESPVGSWTGWQWKLEPELQSTADLASINGTVVSFSVGRRATGGGIIYYNATVVDSGVQTARVLNVVYYDLPERTDDQEP